MSRCIFLLGSLLLCCNLLYAQEPRFALNPKYDSLRAEADRTFERGELEQAVVAFKQLAAKAQSNHDNFDQLSSYIKLLDIYGYFYYQEDSFLLYRQKGLQLSRQLHRMDKELNIETLEAGRLQHREQNFEALKKFQSLEASVTGKGYDFESLFFTYYARLLSTMKRYDESIEKFRHAAAVMQQEHDLNGQAATYSNIGKVFLGQEKYDSALVYSNKALDFAVRLKDTFGISICYNKIGRVLQAQGDTAQALRYFKQAYEITNNPVPELSINYSDVLIQQGKYAEAKGMLLGLLETLPISNIRLHTLKNLTKIAVKQGDFKEALRYSEQNNQEEREFLNENNARQVEELRTQYEVSLKEKEIGSLKERNTHQQKLLSTNRVIFLALIGFLLMSVLTIILNVRRRQLKQDVEKSSLELQLLRSQMNPHFIFNCLSGIQSEVLLNDKTKALNYISLFAKLVRSILENSIQNSVFFYNELESLEDYLALQQLRYEEKLSYNIVVDDKLKEEKLRIPPMLFQPIIENAIEHGISEMDGGFIQISFIRYEKYIECTVTDNGVGYGHGPQKSKGEKKNVSTSIIQRRLSIFSKKIKQDLKHTITVITDANERIQGTKVTVDIPIIS